MIKDSCEVSIRTYYSIQHLSSAILCAKKSSEIETQYSGKFDAVKNIEISSYVTSSIVSIASFVEAAINEFYCDVVDRSDRVIYIPEDLREQLKDIWNNEKSFNRKPALVKYNRALKVLEAKEFEDNTEIIQNIKLLFELRNALVHFKPESYTMFSSKAPSFDKQNKLSERLYGKFEMSPFFKASGNPFFPSKCLSYGCSSWGINNALIYVDEFHRKINLKPFYNHVRETY